MSTIVQRPAGMGPGGRPLLSCRALRQTRAAVQAGRITLVTLSVLAAYAAGRGLEADGVTAVAALTAAWLFSLRLGRLSVPDALGPAVSTGIGTLAGLVVVSALAVWLPVVSLSPARSLAMAGAVLFFVGVWECVVHHLTASRRRVLVVGTRLAADAVAHESSKAAAHLDVLGLVPDHCDDVRGCDVPVVGEFDGLSEVIARLEPDVIVVDDGVDCDSTIDCLLDVPRDGFRIVGFTSFFEQALGRVPLANLRASWFMSILHLRQRAYTRLSKRAFDLVSATVVLLLAAPAMALVALLLAPSRRVLYRQTRLGERGRPFTIVKFRTMAVSAEQAGGAVWSSDDDPRVTRLGRVLRRAHLDELPQLFNVLRGDMSMVGPRPERPEFVELLEREVPFWQRRLLVKPGVTGWAQLKGGYASDCEAMADKLSYDLWYLRNRTVLVDAAICLATALDVLCAFVPGRAAEVEPRTKEGVAA